MRGQSFPSARWDSNPLWFLTTFDVLKTWHTFSHWRQRALQTQIYSVWQFSLLWSALLDPAILQQAAYCADLRQIVFKRQIGHSGFSADSKMAFKSHFRRCALSVTLTHLRCHLKAEGATYTEQSQAICTCGKMHTHTYTHKHVHRDGLTQRITKTAGEKSNCDHVRPNQNFPHGLLDQWNWFKCETKGFHMRLRNRFKNNKILLRAPMRSQSSHMATVLWLLHFVSC